MTPAQVRKAEALLAKRKEMITLTDNQKRERGKIVLGYDNSYNRVPCLCLDSLADKQSITLDTLKQWIKQAEKAHKLGIID
jgi:hypothetical protein